jgi:hypothetical protein
MAGTYAFWYRQKYNLPPNSPLFLSITPEEIESEWWAVHFELNTATVEFDDDDENAATDYLAEIKRQAEEAEAAAAAGEPTPAAAPVAVQEGDPDPLESMDLGPEPDLSGIPDSDWEDALPKMK